MPRTEPEAVEAPKQEALTDEEDSAWEELEQVTSKTGRVLRYNFLFEIRDCCGPSAGLAPEVLEKLPAAMDAKGLPDEVWAKFTARLQGINSKVSRLGACGACLSCIVAVPTLFCCGYLRVVRRRRLRAWDAALRNWQADFNQVLEAFGIFVKTQSKFTSRGVRYERKVIRWLAFALTAVQIRKLKAQPHLLGGPGDSQFCCGHCDFDDDAYCMYPDDFGCAC